MCLSALVFNKQRLNSECVYIKGLGERHMSAEAEAGETAGPVGLENWVIVAEEEATYAELKEYCEIRRLLPLWARVLRGLVEGEENQEANNNLSTLDDVDRVIKGLPAASELLHGMYAEDTEASIAAAAAKKQPPWLQRPWVWRYNSAYCAFSETNVFSRSWLLVTLAGAMQDLNGVWISLPEAIRNKRPRPTLYKLEEFYDIWKKLAEGAVEKPPIGWHRLRETYGRGGFRGRGNGIQHKLDALKRVGEWEGGRTEVGSFVDYWYGRDKKKIEELLVEVARLKKKCGEGAVETGEKTQQPAVAVPKPVVEKAAVTPEIVKAWDGGVQYHAGGETTFSYEVRKCAATDPRGEYQLWCNGDYKKNYTEDMKREAAEESAKAEEKRLKDLKFLAEANERAEKQRTEKAQKKAREERVAAQAPPEQDFKVVYEEWVDVDSRNGNMKMQVREYADGGANGKYQRWVGHILSENNMPEAEVKRDYPQFFVGKPGATTPAQKTSAQKTPVVHGDTVYTGTECREFSNGHTSHTYKIKVYECSGGYEQWADDEFETFMDKATLKQKYPSLPIFKTKTPMSDSERQAWGKELEEREERRKAEEVYGPPPQMKR